MLVLAKLVRSTGVCGLKYFPSLMAHGESSELVDSNGQDCETCSPMSNNANRYYDGAE